MFFYTYVLRSIRDGKHYVGYTRDLRKRIEEHRSKYAQSTKYRLPVELIYYEACRDMQDARHRERYLKSTAGRRFLAKRIRVFRQTTPVRLAAK